MLTPRYVPHRIIGDVVRFTLAYNPGAAFSMSLGQYSRYIFGGFAIVALIVLWRLYRMTGSGSRAGDGMRIVALGLAWGGAAGNLIDRFRSPLGVVDFIDIGFRDIRFWTFNVADSAVTVGALALAWSLSQEDHEQRLAEAAAERTEGIVDAPVGGREAPVAMAAAPPLEGAEPPVRDEVVSPASVLDGADHRTTQGPGA